MPKKQFIALLCSLAVQGVVNIKVPVNNGFISINNKGYLTDFANGKVFDKNFSNKVWSELYKQRQKITTYINPQ
jgi:hypothetical protein